MIYSSEYFQQSEFACKCGCGFGTKEADIAADLVHALHVLRVKFGVPIIIDSAARCTKHNTDVGGKPKSAHLAGVKGLCTPKYEGRCRAADVRTVGWPGETLAHSFTQLALDMGLRVGIAQTFVHLDVETAAFYPLRIWVYGLGGVISSGD